MLWLERLDVVGFKSFSDRASIEFPKGITAVVGPNGCGKSNIADAIQWVLGEQSARALRGQRMEDVIFAGSEGRGPGGMAEVSLHLAVRDEPLPDGRTRVSLTRRLFRTGVSDYLIDGKKARLADVRAVLDQVRAGVRTYAIIDQGHVASFVTSKPRDRRVFIEEAAGIAGYKVRRRAAELKLEATRANLLRVDDILQEVARQQRSLKRQASLARRARRLDETLRVLRTVWYLRRDRELASQVALFGERLAVAQSEVRHLEAERGRVASRLALSREELADAHAKRDAAVEATHATRLEEERLRREIDAARVQAETLDNEAGRREGEGEEIASQRARRREEILVLETAASQLSAGLTEIDERVEHAREEVERCRKQQLSLAGQADELEKVLYARVHERAEFAARLSAAEEAARREQERSSEAESAGDRLGQARREAGAALVQARTLRDETVAEVSRLELEVQTAQSSEESAWEQLESARTLAASLVAEERAREAEKSALDSLEVRLAGSDASRELLEKARDGQFEAQRVIADVLSVEKDVERAAEAFLAEILPTVLVDSSVQVRQGAALGIRGRLRLLPLDSPDGITPQAELPLELERREGVRGRLVSYIQAQDELSESLLARLQDAILVDSLERALELHREFPAWNFLSPEGHVVYATGMVAIEGGRGEEGGLLARTRRREELSAALAVLQARQSKAAVAVETLRSTHRDAQLVRRRLEEDLAEARRGVATARMSVQQAERDLARIEHEVETAAHAHAAARHGLEDARAKAAECVALEERAQRRIVECREKLQQARDKQLTHETTLREAVGVLSELAAESRGLNERQSAHRRDIERLELELAALEIKSEEGKKARELARERAVELRAAASQREARCAELANEREAAEHDVDAWAGRLEEMALIVRELEVRLAIVTDEFEGARGRREAASLSAEKAQIEWRHEQDGCRAELGCEPAQLPMEQPEGIDPELLASDVLLEAEIAGLRGKRERVGPVNLLAESEFEELSARFDELSSQHEDLLASVSELSESIKKMNKESRARFLEAYTEIRKHFRQQFMTLFRGGRGDLLLEDESNPLESGIEIMCQPPGKKLQSVSLLSGGEKALSATAVLFAIFRYHAPPFCLLDEIDAPLDDTNVHRFTEVVREFANETQIILITHNKRSMETADVLYGVTMPQPGISRLVSMTLH